MHLILWISLLILKVVIAVDFKSTTESASHVTNLGGNHDHQSKYPPEVAFQCGYRNRYRDQESGNWVTDTDIHALCLKGKLDILKYCRKAYPTLQITNIVESEKHVTIDNWCKESDVKSCKRNFLSKPFRCLVGEFESEALLVPQGCHFGHVDNPTKCKDFDYWNQTASLECSKRLGDLHVESFSILEPCGLDMFSGVEYVCCPKHATKTEELHVKVHLESESEKKKQQNTVNIPEQDGDDDSEEDDDEDDDDEDEDDEAASKNHLLRFVTASSRIQGATTTKSPNDSIKKVANSDDVAKKPEELLDIYFRVADPEYEHDRYKEALQRLDRKHKKKVSSVMKEWSELEVRYKTMQTKDPKHAQDFRHEMTVRFQKTITALEEEYKEQHRQLEEVHQQRIDAALNERKREAMHRYRDSLADGAQSSTPKVLRTLETYIRSEEKDRVHSLNRYRHLLKNDADQAQDQRPALLRKLRDIDLRINGSIALLKSLPLTKEMKIKDSAVTFWKGFRAENTPDIDDEYLLRLDYSANEKLLDEYKKQYHAEMDKASQENANKIAVDAFIVPTTQKLKEIVATTAATPAKKITYVRTMSPDVVAVKETVEKLEKIIDEKDELDFKTVKHVQPIVFDPVVEIADVESVSDFKESKILDENNPFGSYAKQSFLDRQSEIVEKTIYNNRSQNYSYVVFGIAGVALLVSVLLGTALIRRRSSNHRKGFIEVDACTPEERHVNMMQGNGYENPTYKYFDEKI